MDCNGDFISKGGFTSLRIEAVIELWTVVWYLEEYLEVYKPHICEFPAGFLFLWNVTFIHWTIFSFIFHVYKIKFCQPYNLKVSWIYPLLLFPVIIISNLDYLASWYFWIGIYPPHCIYLSKRQCDSVSFLKKKKKIHDFHVLHHLQGHPSYLTMT